MTVEEQAEYDKIKASYEAEKKEREQAAKALEEASAAKTNLQGELEKITKERDEANAMLREQTVTPTEEVLEWDVVFNNAKEGDAK